MDNREQKILDTIDSLSEDIIDFTCKLVEQQSTLGNEAGAINVMDEKLQNLGFTTERVPVSGDLVKKHPGFAPVPWSHDGKNNVVTQLKPGGNGGKSAIFNGHLDVVDVGNPTFWSHDPFSPYIKDGWLYGRGAGDMKSGVAAMTYAAFAVIDSGFRLCAPLTIEAVVEEECSGNGAVACMANGYDAEAVLIPEPFGPTILTAQLGVMWFKVTLQGRPTHVLEAQGGVNAIDKCYTLIKALRTLEEELNSDPPPPQYESKIHPINLNIGILKGGDWPSTVPAEATFHARLSYYPGTKYEDICNRVRKTIESVAEKDSWLCKNPPTIEFYGFRSDGHIINRKLPALDLLNSCHKSLSGQDAEEYIATCTTDLRAFHHFGTSQHTCFGPVAKNIHGNDERVDVESIMHVARTYALFLARWCRLAE